jgi:hypothetical protein
MNENIDLKQLEEQQFLTTKEKLGYAEEFIVVKCDEPKDDIFLKYSLSNSLDDVKIAIFNRTGLNLKIEKAKWVINTYLSISVKQLMNKHKVTYSMTTYHEDKVRIICINMRVGDNWFNTRYAELKGKCYHWDYFDTLEKLKRFIQHYLSSENDEDDD